MLEIDTPRTLARSRSMTYSTCGVFHIELREDAGQFRALVGLSEDVLDHAGELLDVAAAAVFQDELEAAGGADARNRWRIQRQHVRFLDAAGQPVDACRQRQRAMRRAAPLAPGLKDDEDRRCVGGVGAGEQVQPGDGERRLNLRLLAHQLAEFPGHRFGALQRGADRQGDEANQIALILVRHEAGGPGVQQQQCGGGEDHENRHRARAATDGAADRADVARSKTLEAAVKGAEEAAEDPAEMRFRRRLQQ